MFKIAQAVDHSTACRVRLLRSRLTPLRFTSSRRSMDSSVHSPDAEGFGPLIDRGLDKLWRSESMNISLNQVMQQEGKALKSKSIHIPDVLHEWRRSEDKQASEDETDVVRLGSSERVPDAKLYKVKHGIDTYVSVHTASSSTLIELATDNQDAADSKFWEQILNRAEYLSSTLSVKKIRLLLDRLANAPNECFDEGKLREFVHILGKELLCRYHSMTAYSCASIATSLAKLKCRETGTLNLLALAFEQNVLYPEENIPQDMLVQYSLQMKDAFTQLDHLIPLIEKTVAEVLKNQEAINSNLEIQYN